MGTRVSANTTSPALLKVRDLHAWFETPQGVLRAVDGVSLSVAAGERVGVVGESGSGKTQTFFGLLGLARGAPGVVRGEASFGGTDLLPGLASAWPADAMSYDTVVRSGLSRATRAAVARWRATQAEVLESLLGRQLAILFQDPKRSLIPYFTVRQHLAAAHVEPSAMEDTLRALGFLEPTRILSAYPERLSGGEAQRAMLALTMAMRPKLLIADEPTTGLDLINQARVLEALARLQQQLGMALILISHDLAVVSSLVDRLVVMYGGQVMAEAPASVLRDARSGALHPYFDELRESQVRRAAGQPIEGAVLPPPPPRAVRGCPFQTRCPLRPVLAAARQRQCAEERPVLQTLDGARATACWGMHS
jgi:ABC-type dipeptide/oligopeptide/nickel transport system ATPase component